MSDIRELIRSYLKEAKLMTLATARNNKPWVASVWYVHNEDLNLYFISRKSRRHSLELKENPNVAGAIVIPHFKGSGEKVRGLQFEGTAHDLTGDEERETLEEAKKLYLEKYSMAEDIPIKDLSDPSGIATYYVIHSTSFVLFDEINFPKNPRQELILKNR